MSPEELARILSKENESSLRTSLDHLDERELELFSILAQGYSGHQIHSEFGIGPEQLKDLKERLRKKLGLRTNAQLRRFAAQQSASD